MDIAEESTDQPPWTSRRVERDQSAQGLLKARESAAIAGAAHLTADASDLFHRAIDAARGPAQSDCGSGRKPVSLPDAEEPRRSRA